MAGRLPPLSRSFLTVAALAGLFGLVFSSTPGARQQPPPEYVPGELLIQYKSGVGEARRSAARVPHRASRIRRFQAIDIEHLRLPSDANVVDVARAMRANADVLDAQPNFVRRISAAPDDPYFVNGSLWGLLRIQAPNAWTTFGTPQNTVVVADLDTGVRYDHPDLAANMWTNPGEIPGNNVDDDNNGYIDDVHGIDTVNHDGNPMDDHGHGTHTSGTIAAVANNGTGVVGVARNVRILACKFLNAAGSGSDAGAAECFNYVVAQKNRGVNIRVTNNSWGSARSGGPSAILQNAMDAAGQAGIVNVCAAGNDNRNNDLVPFDPASFGINSVIAVAASTQTDERAGFSSYGATSVDLAAPGTTIWSTVPGGYTSLNGTSMAAPHVAGAAALLLGHLPNLSVVDVIDKLKTSVDPLPAWSGVVATGGRLNLERLLQNAGVNHAPTATITQPSGGSSFTAPATIALKATAGDDGTVTQVQFFANGTLVGTDGTSPYEITWSNVPAGSYSVTAVATDNEGQTGTSTAVSVQVTVPSGTSAAFVRLDTATQGNWKGVYGADGYAVLGDSTSYPAYASVQTSGNSAWTWDSAPTSPRALQRAATGRIASTWYAGSSYSIDINLVDGAAHQLSLYALDWDGAGRAERIDVVNATTGALLDSRSLTGFSNGQYLVWRIQGHVRLDIVRTAGANAVSSGLFFDAAPVTGQPVATLTGPAAGATYTAPATVNLTANASDTDGGSISRVDFYANGQLVGTDDSSPYGGTWSNVSPGSYNLTAVATDNSGLTGTSAAVTIQVNPAATPTTAAFVRSDTTTQGNWVGAYGVNGYAVINDATSYPAYAAVTPSGHSAWTWDAAPASARALRRAGSGRIAATWYAASSYSIDINLTDGAAHQVAVYGLDWDGVGRTQRIDVVNAATGAVLDSRTMTNFSGGQYLVWRLQGHVRLDVVRTGPANAVLSGIFFDPVVVSGAPTATLTAPANGDGYTAPGTVNLAATAVASPGRSIFKVDFYANGQHIGTDDSSPYGGTWLDVAAGTYDVTAVATDDEGLTGTSATARIQVTPPVASTSAGFVRADTVTQGNWIGAFGADGYAVLGDTTAYPSYATVQTAGQSAWTWDTTPASVRALRRVGGGRVAATWYAASSFSIDVNITDGATHQVALYLIDWDGAGRSERIDVVDATTGVVLDSRTIAGFSGGQYLVWNIAGHVALRVVKVNGANAVVSGVFFDSAPLTPGAIQPSDLTVRVDAAGQMPAATNSASPVVVGSQLLLVDQTGRLYRWDGANSHPLLTPATMPASITPTGQEALLNVAANAAGDTLYVVFTSSSLPSGIPQRLSPRPGADAWHVLYRYDFDGTALSNPQPVTALQVRPDGHTGGGLVVLEDGALLLATGDNGDAGEDGREYPQDLTTHLSKILRIDPATGAVTVAAAGVRNVQRLAVRGSGGAARIEFTDFGGSVAEELNSVLASALVNGSMPNFGWGRNGDGQAREGTFFIDAAGVAIGSALNPEAGFHPIVAQFGREAAQYVGVSGPVTSTTSFSRITALFGDLVSGAVAALQSPTSTVGQPVYRVNLVDAAGQPVTLTALAGGGRPDPRFFNFPDGGAGVLLEATGSFYRLTELP